MSTATSFAIRRGGKNAGPIADTLFYLVFGTKGFNALWKAKNVFSKVSQEKDQLSFSNYYPMKNLDVPFGRKLTIEEEAQVIYDRFRGRTNLRLGWIKAEILENEGKHQPTVVTK